MADYNDPSPDFPPRRKRIWPYFVVPFVAMVVGYLLVYRIVNEPRGPEGSPQVALNEVEPTGLVDGGQPISVEEGDANLREQAAAWSADQLYARWLESVSLRHLVAAAQLVADGENVKPALPFLGVPGPFAVREVRPAPAQERLFINSTTYTRYDVLARVAGSVDAAAAGDAYKGFKIFCDSAFAEISPAGKVFDEVLASALRRFTQLRVLEGEVELEPKGAVYAFKDPSLEALSAADKQFLRMGPKNGRVFQRQFRVFAQHAKLDINPGER